MWRVIFLVLSVSVFSNTILILNTCGIDTNDLISTFEIHSPGFRIERVSSPTLGEARWRIAEISKENEKILIFVGDLIDSVYLKLSDTNPDFPKESALDLRDLDLGPESLIIVITKSELDVQKLRRIGWRGRNIIIMNLDRLTDFKAAIGDADLNGDGFVSLFELGDSLSGKVYAFLNEDWKIFLSTDKISTMAFEKVRKLFKSGKLNMEDSLLIIKSILLEDRSAFLFGVGKLNVAELLVKLKGR